MRAVGTANPMHFQRAMAFIDGTNLFYRLTGAKLKLMKSALHNFVSLHVDRRHLVRTYLYTVEDHFNMAKQTHGASAFEFVRAVFGDAVPTGDGNIREKGVDALLVADLVYHAAARNFDHALLVSVDTDFAHALDRVADFGCTTAVAAICAPLPERLRAASDRVWLLSRDDMITQNFARDINAPA